MATRKNIEDRTYWILAAIFIAAKICLHLITSSGYELHRDEMPF